MQWVLDGPLGKPKRGLVRTALERLAGAIKRAAPANKVRKWLGAAASITETAVTSLAKEIPGGEVVAEAIGGIRAGLESIDAIAEPEVIP